MRFFDTTRRNALKLLGGGTLLAGLGTGTATAATPGRLFTFNELRGNQGPFVGADGAIRGVEAGGLPWVLDEAQAKLHANGRLQVRVQGLVLNPDDDRVPPGLRGTNPVDEFTAILSCLTFDGGTRTIVNTDTAPVPASDDGDARINEVVPLEDPCYAPIVFVTSPGGSWFATTGF